MVVLHHSAQDIEGVGSGQMAICIVDVGRQIYCLVVA
jgi:hypothetical protein